MSERAGGCPARERAGAAGVFLLAVAVRALPWPQVLTEKAVYPFGNDAYYHLRRIVYTLTHFPSALEFDPYINFPSGAKAIWTPVFDFCLAVLARPWFGEVSDASLLQLQRVAVWLPVLLGGACVLATYRLALRHFGFMPALLAGAALSVLSGHFWYSQLGFLDHHAAEALLAASLVAAGMSLLRAWGEGAQAAAWRWSIGAGLLVALSLLLWPGALLHVALVDLGLFVYLLRRTERADARRFAARLALLHGLAALLVAPLCIGNEWPQWSAYSPVVLTPFQPWLLTLVALGCLFAAGLWAVPALGSSRPRRLGTLAGVALGLLAASVALEPELLATAGEAWQWLARKDHFQRFVAESRPLFITEGEFEFETVTARLSYFFFLFPLAAGGLALAARRRPQPAPLWLLLGWSLGLFAMAIAQRRFLNTFSIGLAVVLGLSLVWGYREVVVRGRLAARGQLLARLVCGALLPLLLAPTLASYEIFVTNIVQKLRGEKIAVPTNITLAHAAVHLSAWMRRFTPETAGWLDPAAQPQYGVLAPWYMGHIIKFVARRPTLVDNFGDDVGHDSFLWSLAYYASREPEMLAGLDERRIRYVVVHRAQGRTQTSFAPDSLFHSLYTYDGARFEPEAGEGGSGQGVPALTRHRLVYESVQIPYGGPDAPPIYKLFELVPGALVAGRAAPGTQIELALRLRTNRKRAFDYVARAIAGPAGSWQLRVPYATRGGPRSIRAQPAYELRCGGATASLVLTEVQIQRGERVEAPPVCGDAGGDPPRAASARRRPRIA